MREIKFRVWDKNKKEMNFGGAFQTLEFDGIIQEWFGLPTPHPDDCELMQYTGLKDRNGKEIYEGDICKFYHHPDDVVVVSYDEELLSSKVTVVSGGIYCEDYFFIVTDSNKYEVIGNIYENPNLLV